MKRKLAIACVSALLALPVAEGLGRAVLALRGRAHDPGALAARMRHLVDPMGTFVPEGPQEGGPQTAPPTGRQPLLHPYSGSESAHDTGGVLAAFQEGFAPETYTVVVVGGSVAAGWARTEGPAFERGLAADPRLSGRRVRVLNYAHASYKQPQQLMRVAYLFSLGHRPDAVLAIDGFNEVALSLQNRAAGVHPVYPPPPVWSAIVRDLNVVDPQRLERAGRLWSLRLAAERRASRALAWKLHHSCVLGPLVVRDLERILRERAALQTELLAPGSSLPPRLDRQRSGPEFDPDPAAVLELGARNWSESALSIHALCAARAVKYLHVLQPALHDAGAKPHSAEERALGPAPEGWLEGARDGYPLLRAQVPGLLALGVPVLDLSRTFADEHGTLFVDPCHLNARGNALLTERILETFLEHLPPAPRPAGR